MEIGFPNEVFMFSGGEETWDGDCDGGVDCFLGLEAEEFRTSTLKTD